MPIPSVLYSPFEYGSRTGAESEDWTLQLDGNPPAGATVVLLLGVGNGWDGGSGAQWGMPTAVSGLGATWTRVQTIKGPYHGMAAYVGVGCSGATRAMTFSGGYVTRWAMKAIVLDGGVFKVATSASGAGASGVLPFTNSADGLSLGAFLLDTVSDYYSREVDQNNRSNHLPSPWGIYGGGQMFAGGSNTSAHLSYAGGYSGPEAERTFGFFDTIPTDTRNWLGIGVTLVDPNAPPPFTINTSPAAGISGAGQLSLSAVADIAPPPVVIEAGALNLSGSGQLSLTTTFSIPKEVVIEILDPVIPQAPTPITVVLVEGYPDTDVEFSIDGTWVYTARTNSDGYLPPTSINVSEALGSAGVHTLTAEQPGAYSMVGSATFTIQKDPILGATYMGPDAQAVEIPEAIRPNGTRRWVFQDLLPGGLGSWVMPTNPTENTSPYLERQYNVATTTTGRPHVSEGGQVPVEWSFSGIAFDEVFAEKLVAYWSLNRRFYVINHRNQAFKVVITNVDLRPRLQRNYNGEYIDGHDYTVSALVLDQNWVTPA